MLTQKLLDSNLEKSNLCYERLAFIKRLECDYQSVMLTEKEYNG